MDLDPELQKALTSHPAITNLLSRPEGISAHEYARQIFDQNVVAEVKRFHEARLPPGTSMIVGYESYS